MSVFYDQASLVLVPSGYKSGVVYSQKPMTTDGQLSFTRASTATRVNSSGLIASVASGVPRLDYLGSTCPKLLLEPQRTNLALYSQALDTSAEYSVSDAAFTANAGTSPDGTANADLLTENSAAASHGFYAPVTERGTTGAALTTSIFAKANGRRYFVLAGGFDSSNYYNATFDLQSGVVTEITNAGSTTTPTASIVSYGNGWYRCIVTGSASFANRLAFVYFSDSATGNGVAGKSYTGDGTSGAYFYGLQIEAGAYATSYIPTTSAAVTRVADGSGTSDNFGKTFTLSGDFGLYWEGVINGTLVYPCFYSGGNYAAGADYRSYFVYNGNTFQLFGVNEVLTAQLTASISLGTLVKILVKRVGSTIKWYINGNEYANATGATTTTVKMRSLFGSTLGAPNHESVAQALIFETTLSDAQGIELTAV